MAGYIAMTLKILTDMTPLFQINIDHNVLNSINDPIMLLDNTGRIYFINNTTKKLFSPFFKNSLIGLLMADLIEKPIQEDFITHFNETIKGDKNKSVYFKTNIISPDSSNISIFLTMSHIDSKSQSYIMIIVKDFLFPINEMNISNDQEAFFSTLFEIVYDTIVCLNSNSIVFRVNSAFKQTFNYNDDDIIGQSVEKLMIEENTSSYRKYINSSHTHDSSIIRKGLQLTAVNRAGNQFPVLIDILSVHMSGKRFFIGIIKDLSKQESQLNHLELRKNQMEKLLRLSLMSEVTSGIAHQLHQPLASLSSQLQMWMSRQTSVSQGSVTITEDELHETIQLCDKMAEIIDRINNKSYHSKSYEKLTLRAILNRIIKRFNLPNLEISISYTPFSFASTIFEDDFLLDQCLIVLIQNSIDAFIHLKYINNTINIDITSKNNVLVLLYTDNGPGISNEIKDSIFEPFFTTKTISSGIGLSLIKTMLVATLGCITLMPADKGVKFLLTIPIKTKEQRNET